MYLVGLNNNLLSTFHQPSQNFDYEIVIILITKKYLHKFALVFKVQNVYFHRYFSKSCKHKNLKRLN